MPHIASPTNDTFRGQRHIPIENCGRTRRSASSRKHRRIATPPPLRRSHLHFLLDLEVGGMVPLRRRRCCRSALRRLTLKSSDQYHQKAKPKILFVVNILLRQSQLLFSILNSVGILKIKRRLQNSHRKTNKHIEQHLFFAAKGVKGSLGMQFPDGSRILQEFWSEKQPASPNA